MTSGPEAPSEPATAVHRKPGRARPSTNRWVLVVPALLVVALVLLVVGLVTSGSGWLGASLVASVLAALLLVVERLVQRRRSPAAAPEPAPAAATTGSTDTDTDTAEPAPPVDLDAPSIDPDDPEAVWVVDGRPRYHARDCATIASLEAEPIARSQALEDGFVACSLCSPSVPGA